ncbi:MAG: DUF262 domain-containing protein [Myxococcales bacterium]|nr:DUF262 domain-containing protein [Myxococcales bacterium]
MNTNVLTIEQVFSERIFRVPDYQRGYAWEDEHRADFLEDLELLGAGKEHYTGTLVLHAQPTLSRVQDEAGRSYGLYDVVDGQQRLTTIVLLLDAIRRELAQSKKFDKLAEGIALGYIAVRDFYGASKHKLQLNSDVHDYFVNNVLADIPGPTEAKISSHQRLRDARMQFAEHIEDRKKSLGASFDLWLVELHRKVTQQLKLSLYTVGDAAEVGVVFEVMNNRGKSLTNLEKVKNYLLYLCSKLDVPASDLSEMINKRWADIFMNLMSANLASPTNEDQLLRAHWIASKDHDVKRWDGSKSIKQHFNLKHDPYRGDHKTLRDDLLAYVRSLGDASIAYRDALAPSFTHAFNPFVDARLRHDVRQSSERLRRMHVTAPFLPLLISARLSLGSDGHRYLEVVRLCEAFAFRVYKLRGSRSDTGHNMLFRLAYELFHEPSRAEPIVAELRRRLLEYSPNNELESWFGFQAAKDENNWFDWSAIKFFLYEYEEYRAGKDAVKVSWDVIEGRELAKTIEHILPQSADAPYWTERFSKTDHEKYVHDIGNLCLTAHNGSLSNKPFPAKRGTPADTNPCYANSQLVIERDLAAYEEWTPKTILARREAIVKWALERWRVDEAPTSAPSPAEMK